MTKTSHKTGYQEIYHFRGNTKNGNKGTITYLNTTTGKRYFATTPIDTNTYKTLTGARKFMERKGYKLSSKRNNDFYKQI